jgi:abortive infection bacteriophage resistance protein
MAMTKPALSIRDQIALLESRGLGLTERDRSYLERFLLDVNYFRASGYWRMFFHDPKNPTSGFRPNVKFKTIEDVYLWDSELRHLLLRGLSDYEIVFRARFAHYFSLQFDPRSFTDITVHREVIRETGRGSLNLRVELLNALKRDLRRASEPIVSKALELGETPPIWTAIESLSMGTVSRMYEVAHDDIRYKLSRSLGLPSPAFAESLFRSLTIFRNHLAHHGRVWHHRPEFPPQVLKVLKTSNDESIYERTPWALIIGLCQQMDEIAQSTHWSQAVLDHIDSKPEFLTGLTHPLNKIDGYVGLGKAVSHHGD